jgi:hypothetical protein
MVQVRPLQPQAAQAHVDGLLGPVAAAHHLEQEAAGMAFLEGVDDFGAACSGRLDGAAARGRCGRGRTFVRRVVERRMHGLRLRLRFLKWWMLNSRQKIAKTTLAAGKDSDLIGFGRVPTAQPHHEPRPPSQIANRTRRTRPAEPLIVRFHPSDLPPLPAGSPNTPRVDLTATCSRSHSRNCHVATENIRKPSARHDGPIVSKMMLIPCQSCRRNIKISKTPCNN